MRCLYCQVSVQWKESWSYSVYLMRLLCKNAVTFKTDCLVTKRIWIIAEVTSCKIIIFLILYTHIHIKYTTDQHTLSCRLGVAHELPDGIQWFSISRDYRWLCPFCRMALQESLQTVGMYMYIRTAAVILFTLLASQYTTVPSPSDIWHSSSFLSSTSPSYSAFLVVTFNYTKKIF
jgi:hypothetical protein